MTAENLYIVRTWGAAVLRPYMVSAVIVGPAVVEFKPRDLGNDRGYRVASFRFGWG